MSRAPRLTPTDEHARRIARAFAKGRPPPMTLEFERFCESAPREVFTAFAGLARHLPPAGDDEALAVGYLVVLQRLLESLRYRTDRGYADATELIAEFQSDVVRQIRAGEVDASVLAVVGDVLHQSKISASTELAALAVDQPVELDEDGSPPDIGAALDEIVEACSGDPFEAAITLTKGSHAMPVEARGAVAGAMVLGGSAPVRSVAVLFLLDPEASIRSAIAEALEEIAASLTPTDVRRLISMRNWRPESERARVDAIVRKARAAGVDCAQWDEGGVKSIDASAIDGSATQMFLLVSPSGRQARLSSLMTKGGIADAWSHEPEPRRGIEREIAEARKNIPTLAVSRSYLDRAIAHQLALGLENGGVPPIGLLQVAETIGGADWQPSLMPFEKTLAELIAEIPRKMRQPATATSILQRSDELVDLEGIAQSWFEDSPEVAQAIERAPGASRAKLATYLLQTVFPRHRQKWADMVLRTALWMHEASPGGDLCWPDLAIVAQALADGRDMTEIGLMHDIAMRTVDVLREARPL
ncbi:MAG: hypothetical protein U1E60_28695 [Reyranellaceae bacterium]